jgi:hypothetical protein
MPLCAAPKQVPPILGEHLIAGALIEVPINTNMSASVMEYHDRLRTRKPGPAAFSRTDPQVAAQPVFNERTYSGTLSPGN